MFSHLVLAGDVLCEKPACVFCTFYSYKHRVFKVRFSKCFVVSEDQQADKKVILASCDRQESVNTNIVDVIYTVPKMITFLFFE